MQYFIKKKKKESKTDKLCKLSVCRIQNFVEKHFIKSKYINKHT